MTTKGLLVAGLYSMSILACAGDPNKQANDAHDAELKSERKQQQSNADDRSDARVKAAEAQREHTEATLDSASAATQDAAKARLDKAWNELEAAVEKRP